MANLKASGARKVVRLAGSGGASFMSRDTAEPRGRSLSPAFEPVRLADSRRAGPLTPWPSGLWLLALGLRAWGPWPSHPPRRLGSPLQLGDARIQANQLGYALLEVSSKPLHSKLGRREVVCPLSHDPCRTQLQVPDRILRASSISQRERLKLLLQLLALCDVSGLQRPAGRALSGPRTATSSNAFSKVSSSAWCSHVVL